MGKDLMKQGALRNYTVYLKSFVIEAIITAVLAAVFALVMFVLETGYRFAPVFATASVAAGAFAAALYAARKIGSKGLLTGFIIGGITFLIVTLVSLIIDDGGLTFNTLFHLIIIMLASLIGGVIGVNRYNNRKYI